jgi:hypothetical protein
VLGRRKAEAQLTDRDAVVGTVLPHGEGSIESRRFALAACKGGVESPEHVGPVAVWHIQRDVSVAEHGLHRLTREQQQIQNVICVHVRHHDRVHLAEESATPQAFERPGPAIEEDRVVAVRD